MKAVNPGVVYCSVSAFGQTGAYRDKPAHDVAVQALAGVIAAVTTAVAALIQAIRAKDAASNAHQRIDKLDGELNNHNHGNGTGDGPGQPG